MSTLLARNNIALQRLATRYFVMPFVIVLLLLTAFLINYTMQHNNYLKLKRIANSYHYQIGQQVYCWSDNNWQNCTILGMEDNYMQYFVQFKDYKMHITPDNITQNGVYKEPF